MGGDFCQGNGTPKISGDSRLVKYYNSAVCTFQLGGVLSQLRLTDLKALLVKYYNLAMKDELFFLNLTLRVISFQQNQPNLHLKKIPQITKNPSTGRVPLNQCVLRLYCDFARVFSLHGWVHFESVDFTTFRCQETN